MTPIFLISLPRSGSTFLQKILMSHSHIDSGSESWFLLPLVYMGRSEGVWTEYGHQTSVCALGNIMQRAGGKLSMEQLIRQVAESVYVALGTGREYFLDKTPRYYLILDELYANFPEAKFIILYRNPVSIFASSIEALRGNRMRRMDHLDRDFYVGPGRIADFTKTHANEVLSVRYEDLVSHTETSIKGICDYLNIAFEPGMIEKSFGIQLVDGLGDHLGATQYKEVRKVDTKWKKVIDSRVRKRRLKNYLRCFSADYMQAGGYHRDECMAMADGLPVSKIGLQELVYWLEEMIIRGVKHLVRWHS